MDRLSECPLCQLQKITEWKYEDDKIIVCRCASHPDKWLIVLRRHTPIPSSEELEHMQQTASKLFPQGKLWRGPKSILDHWHWHEE